MPRLLTVGMLVLLLWPWAAPSDAQAQGPGPREVPSELWEEYPLEEQRSTPRNEEPRTTPREQPTERPGDRPRPAPRAIDRTTSDGGDSSDATTAFLIVGLLLLLAASAVLVVARASGRGVAERFRDKKRALRRRGPRASPAVDGRRPQTGIKPAAGRTFQRSNEPLDPATSGQSRGLPIGPGGSQRPPAATPAAGADVPPTAESTRRPSAPRPRHPTGSTQGSSPAPDRDARADGSPSGQPALGYACVPEGDNGKDSMRRQQEEIDAICSRKGLELLKLVRDVESRGGSDLNRPGLTYVLEHLKAHDASCLVVASLERLSRSAANLGTLVEWLDRRNARLVVVDIDLDTGTPEGRLVAKALAAVGGSERKTLMQRTRKGLEAARLAQRSSGQRSESDAPLLKQRIAEMRAGGMTLQAIADTLNAEGVPTLRGGALWRPSSVQAAAGYKRPNRASPLA
jgi:DNA invertase Pin-like site-specific DNA recombinase